MNSSPQFYLEGFLAGAGRAQPAVETPSSPVSPANPPLSWEEQTKRDLFPFDAFPRLAACARADEPPSNADCFRFQWFGLFYQGPETDAFIARVRLSGGRVQGFQWLELARIVQECAGGYVEFNAQGGLDVPGVPVRAGVELLRRLEGIGLSTRGTGGDCVRAVRGGEREDVAMVHELEHALAQGREFGDLPGPCEVAFCTPQETADPGSLVFRAGPPPNRGQSGPEGWPSAHETNPRTWRVIVPGSGDLGVAVAAAETVPVCLALLRVWSRQANRERREDAALACFGGELGMAGWQEAVERELGRTLARSPAADVSAGLVDGPVEIEVPGGRLLSGQMEALAGLAARHGRAEVRVAGRGCLLVPAGGDSAACEAELRRILSAGGSA